MDVTVLCRCVCYCHYGYYIKIPSSFFKKRGFVCEQTIITIDGSAEISTLPDYSGMM